MYLSMGLYNSMLLSLEKEYVVANQLSDPMKVFGLFGRFQVLDST